MDHLDEVTVVVRGAGERTKAACVQFLRPIFPDQEIFVVETMPFSKAITDCWDIGVENGKAWTLCIDADVLVSESGIRKLLGAIRTVENDIFEIQGLVLDKFIPILRPAGNHLYRTAYVDKARPLIPAEGSSLRPESDMLNSMIEQGFRWVQCDALVGIHDFEQNFKDIFKKCFLQARKHSSILPVVENYWIQNAHNDHDFAVALWASLSGKMFPGVVYVDRRFMEEEADKIIQFLHLSEKDAFTLTEHNDGYVGHHLQEYFRNPNNGLQDKIFNIRQWNKIYSMQRSKRKGVYQTAINRFGEYLIHAGKRLKSIGN